MGIVRIGLLFAFAFGLSSAPRGAQQDGGRLVVVAMTDFAFSPSRIVAHPGDTIRFVQRSASPHNVEFRDTPEGTRFRTAGTAGDERTPLRMGPFLLALEDTYDVIVGSWFAEGSHEIVCTPHVTMGMSATIEVRRDARVD